MSYQLTVAAKAPVVAFSELILAAFVNTTTEQTVKIEFVDAKDIDGSNLKLTKDEQVVSKPFEALTDLLKLTKSSGDWISFAGKLTTKDFKKLSPELDVLEAHLNLRSFICDHRVSDADVAIWGALRSNPVMGGVLRGATYINISRWYSFLENDKRFGGIVELMNQQLNELKKSLKTNEGGKKKSHKANFDIDLQDAKDGQVVTRFPPEPSGYLHIGHAKAAILNQYFANMYHGKLIIRFDDTNPSKEKTEFQDSILEDLELLGIKGDKVTYSSDYFQKMYELAIQLIKEGKAYCDDTPLEQMRAERMDGLKSQRRDRSVEENLQIFTEEMKNGTEVGLKNCLRAKIDYTALNKLLRDPVIYRCNLTPHHRTGTEWKMYPLYDFCVPVVDSLEGVTHALRTIEYRDRNPQYDWFLELLKLRKVHIWDFGRVNFVRTLLSKRKLQWFVDKKYVPNWDDPRFPTVRGVRRRGMTVEGLRNFILSQGPSRNIINLDWSLIWANNKKIIDPVAPRHVEIDRENCAVVNIVDGPETPVVELKPKHKKNPDVGMKKVIYSNRVLIEQVDALSIAQGEEVTFMDWGNVIIDEIEKDLSGVVTSMKARLHLEGDFKKTSKKITWLSDDDKKVDVELVDFDHLITKDKLEEGDNFEDFLTPKTEFHSLGYGDCNVKEMKVGDIIQFERKGFYRLDKVGTDNEPYVFFTIPDGKAAKKTN